MDRLQKLSANYLQLKNQNLYGRYITFHDIESEIKKLDSDFRVEKIGTSVLHNPIHSVTFGIGPVKILGWSQMHGNESTPTKALFDLFNLIKTDRIPEVSEILKTCTIKIIPMLNPDGAARYTRENVNGVDLNRDAQKLREPESRLLRNCFDAFKPDFCFNLHDQRTIFGAGNSGKPATLSFLAPALDEERSIPVSRKKAMQLIASVNSELAAILPGQIGRFDDSFNLNCTGDSFQALKSSTILFEAGHFQNDYLREKSREYMFFAIFASLSQIVDKKFESANLDDYFKIPENQKNFYDVILKNARMDGESVDVAIQFEEKIKKGKIDFAPIIKLISPKIEFHSHHEIDCKGKKLSKLGKKRIGENDIVNQILLNDDKLTIKTQ